MSLLCSINAGSHFYGRVYVCVSYVAMRCSMPKQKSQRKGRASGFFLAFSPRTKDGAAGLSKTNTIVFSAFCVCVQYFLMKKNTTISRPSQYAGVRIDTVVLRGTLAYGRSSSQQVSRASRETCFVSDVSKGRDKDRCGSCASGHRSPT